MRTVLIGDGEHHHRSTPSLSKFKQLDWPELTLPVKFCQFRMPQLDLTDRRKIKLRPVGLCYAKDVDW